MPTRDRFNPRSFFGFTGQPLAVPAESVPMPQQMADRFARHGQSAFTPYIDPFATLARTQEYNRANNAFQIGDAENEFMGNLDTIAASPSGLSDFLQKHPAAVLSPMVRTWQKMTQPTTQRDPYEHELGKEGSAHLDKYRDLVSRGMSNGAAYSHVRDDVNKAREASKKTQDDELFFVEKGGDLDDFEALKTAGASRAQMLDHINKKGKPLTSTEAKKLSELQSDMDASLKMLDPQGEEAMKAHDDEKIEAFKTKYGREPSTKPEWEEAFMMLKASKVGPKEKAYQDYLTILEENGKRIPKAKGAAAPAAVVPQAKSPYDGGAPAIVAPPVAPAVVPPVKAKTGLSPLSQVRQALKP